jgi:hypothetical protein
VTRIVQAFAIAVPLVGASTREPRTQAVVAVLGISIILASVVSVAFDPVVR